MGAGKWRPEYSESLRAMAVVILVDNDSAGRSHALTVASSLLDVAASARILELPGLREKGDVTDWQLAGGTIEQLKGLTESATPLDATAMSELRRRWGIEGGTHTSHERSAPDPDQSRGDSLMSDQGSDRPEPNGLQGDRESLPQIKVSGRELRESSAEVLAALHERNDPPKLFSRGGTVVRVDLAEDGRPIIIGVADVHLRGEMTRAANFFKVSKRGEDFIRTPVSPPLDVARDLLSRPMNDLGFPVLDSVVEAPFIRPDGAVISRPGC